MRIKSCTYIILLLLTACGGGGGGGGGGSSAPAANQAPVAEARAPGSALAGDFVTLDGSASRDPDGSIVTWQWEQVEGPGARLENSSSAQSGLIVPNVKQDTQLVFTLTVTDNDGDSSSASVSVRAQPLAVLPTFDLAGAINTSGNQTLDSDINNEDLRAVSNNTIETAQDIPNPTTLGGYVNQPGSGASGRSTLTGDTEDFFRVNLLAGQTVTMLVADFEQADADLYLYSTEGEILDSSIAIGEIESITIPADGTYLVNASAFDGATAYILAIGSRAAATSGARLRDIVPWQAVVNYLPLGPQTVPSASPANRMALERIAGDPGRENLMLLRNSGLRAEELGSRLGKAADKRAAIRDPALRARWETLMTIKSLRRDPQVAHAEPNYRMQALVTPDDEAFTYQWHLQIINLPAAWELTTGAPDVTVAVVDTGVLTGHPDLRGRLTDGFDFVRDPRSGLDGDGIDPNPADPGSGGEPGSSSFHGTHVSGTIAAAGNNGIGVTGVAYSARVMPLRALGAGGSGTSYDVRQAVRFAAGLVNDSGRLPERAADIINLSLGGSSFSRTDQELFNEIRNRGILVVAAAGNEATTAPSYPAAYDNVISVSAVDSQRRITAYSNTGPRVDVAAPGGNNGVDVNGDGYPDGVLSTGGTDGIDTINYAYTFLSGTSMAAPHVAGVFALMKSVNPDLSAADMAALLERGELSDDLGAPGRDDRYGHGLINAPRAVTAALEASGISPADNPRLAASASILNFAAGTEALEIALSNGGAGELELLNVTADQPWLSITPRQVDSTNGLGNYRVEIDRTGLAAGVHAANISAVSSINTVNIQVLASVGGDLQQSDIGVVYVLLFDPELDDVAGQFNATLGNGDYGFSFRNIPQGNYTLIAGTDSDNDRFICDSGEACGAWLTLDQPIAIELNSDRVLSDFPVEFQVAIPEITNRSQEPVQDQRSKLLPLRPLARDHAQKSP